MVLVNRTISAATTRVRQVPSDTPLEERLTSLTGKLTVVFSAALISTHHTFDVLLVLVGTLRWRTGLGRSGLDSGRGLRD